jgi:hypothetical protein
MEVAYKKIAVRKRGASQGQAMIESIFVVIAACLCFLALFQYANLYAAKMTLTHAATRAARARSVGLNYWMMEKAARAASIPVSGKCLVSFDLPASQTGLLPRRNVGDVWDVALAVSPGSAKAQYEMARVPEFMGSENDPTSREILDYELWDDMSVSLEEPLSLDGETPGVLEVTVRQRQPLLISIAALLEGAFTSDAESSEEKSLTMRGTYSMESQYPLYMENMNW